MDAAAIKKYKSKDNWYDMLKTAGCTAKQLSPEIQEMSKKKDIEVLLDVAMAYSQLSNIRWERDSRGRKTKNSNALEANDCFLRAVEIYAKILELDKRNVMAYQSKAYDFYKYVIDHFTGKNKPALKNMKDVNIVECFDKMNATYDMLFAIDRPLAPVSEIKAKYRRGKAWGEVVLNPTNPIGQKIRDHIQKSRTSMMIHAVKDLQRAIAIYESLEKKVDKDAAYNLYIKSLYTLGVLYTNNVYDNSLKKIQINNKNTSIFLEFINNPETVDLTQYRPAQHLENLTKAHDCFQTILNSYNIERCTKIDMKQLAWEKEVRYPISPHYIFYRFGTLYAKWFLVHAIPQKTRYTQLDKAYIGVYFFFLANEYCLWRKKMRLPLAKYDYILKEMNKLLKAAAIDFYRDEHIKNMLSNFDTVLTKIELP